MHYEKPIKKGKRQVANVAKTVGRRLKLRVSVTDRLQVASTKPVGNGYLAVRANVARSGVYKYARSEIGLEDGGDPNELVGVYRSPEFTFDEASLATIAHRPVTLNHPPKGVSAKTWRKDAVGHSGGAVDEAQDRKHVQVDMLLMDEDGVQAAQTTHKEISLGYSTTIRPEIGVSPEGEDYVAVMADGYICDHIALVPAGRAGHTCRVGDAAWPTEIEDTVPPKKEAPKMKIVYDGLTVDLSDEGAATAFAKKLTDAKDAAEKVAADATKTLTDAEAAHAIALADAKTATDKLDAEVATLKQAVEDAKVTPEQMRDAARQFAAVVDAAAKFAPAFKVEDSMGEADIRKGAVLAKLGDAYKEKPQAFFDAAFEIEADKVKDQKAPVLDALQQSFANPTLVTNLADTRTAAVSARQEMIDAMVNSTAADAK